MTIEYTKSDIVSAGLSEVQKRNKKRQVFLVGGILFQNRKDIF